MPDRSWEVIHKEACEQGHYTYVDPELGQIVFTEIYLLKRGYCCGCGCRHCPYVKEQKEES